MQLTPRMGSLSEVYNTLGEVMTKEIRQRLSDQRTSRQGKASVPVPASKDVTPHGGKAATGLPGAPSGTLPLGNVFCVPCVVTMHKVSSPPFLTNTSYRSEELCECVSFKGGAATLEFFNTASVFLSGKLANGGGKPPAKGGNPKKGKKHNSKRS